METVKVIGDSGRINDWSQLDWKSTVKNVKNRRKRIYRATRNGQWNKVIGMVSSDMQMISLPPPLVEKT